MGNKQSTAQQKPQIALKLDRGLQYAAGGVVEGRVYLSIPKPQTKTTASSGGDDDEDNATTGTGIRLVFEGYENSEIVVDDDQSSKNGGGDGTCNPNYTHGNSSVRRVSRHRYHQEGSSSSSSSSRSLIDRSTNTIIKTDYLVVPSSNIIIDDDENNPYEYSFQWRLPSNLPSSMIQHCSREDDSSSGRTSFRERPQQQPTAAAPASSAEIRYTLTAYLSSSSSSSSGGEYYWNEHSPIQDTTAIFVTAAKPYRNVCSSSGGSSSDVVVGHRHQQQEYDETPVAVMGMKSYPIKGNSCSFLPSLLFWNNDDKGCINMGWQIRSTIGNRQSYFSTPAISSGIDASISPGETVLVDVYGNNYSTLPIQLISIKWIETVTWWSSSSSSLSPPSNTTTTTATRKHRSITKSRTLAEDSIPTDGLSCWDVTSSPPCEDHPPLLSSSSPVVVVKTAQLRLPMDARDTYNGRFIQVRHAVVVTAEMDNNNNRGLFSSLFQTSTPITSPESMCQVKVAPQSQSVAAVGCSCSCASTSGPLPQAQAQVVTNSSQEEYGQQQQPIVAGGEAVEINDKQLLAVPFHPGAHFDDPAEMRTEAVLADGSRDSVLAPFSSPTNPTYSPTAAAAAAATSSIVQPSAPDESLQYVENQEPDLSQLSAIVKDMPENLEVVLQDPVWAAFVQNLSPRDYGSVLQTMTATNNTNNGAADDANNNSTVMVPSVAVVLARTMGSRFECRYLLAILRSCSLPESIRMDVLRSVAPLAPDISAANQSLIEQELSPTEILHLRAALYEDY